MPRSVCPSVCLSHIPSSKWCIVGLWLLQNTNRKPRAVSRTHWPAWLYAMYIVQPLKLAEITVALTATKLSLAPLQKDLLGDAIHQASGVWQHRLGELKNPTTDVLGCKATVGTTINAGETYHFVTICRIPCPSCEFIHNSL